MALLLLFTDETISKHNKTDGFRCVQQLFKTCTMNYCLFLCILAG